jgi:hypothetical protein
MSDATLLTQLEAAIAGLTWMSESDYPFEIVQWPQQTVAALTDETLRSLTNHPPQAPVERREFKAFFTWVTTEQDWHGEDDRAIVKRYQELVALLEQHLTDLQVYRIGEINLDIYILGQTAIDGLVGLATKAVET